ncbi:MAG: hypothetical protein O3B03_06590, partial [Proteobacteria bacterium]|nr:hypothetical protein [Pseudomonadota bacterium]
PQDDAKAVKWYRRAAEQGNAKAQYNLGLMYDNGQGVPQDYQEAGHTCLNPKSISASLKMENLK